MKKDIPQPKVEELAIAIVPRPDGTGEDEFWDVFIMNLREAPIQNVLVSSKGYGKVEGEEMKTDTFRHFFERIDARQLVQIEPIHRDLFQLANEFWVSFTYDGHMYDKKYVFVRGSIDEKNFTTIPLLERPGVMIR